MPGWNGNWVVFQETALSSFEISLKDIRWSKTKNALSPNACIKKYGICNSPEFAKHIFQYYLSLGEKYTACKK